MAIPKPVQAPPHAKGKILEFEYDPSYVFIDYNSKSVSDLREICRRRVPKMTYDGTKKAIIERMAFADGYKGEAEVKALKARLEREKNEGTEENGVVVERIEEIERFVAASKECVQKSRMGYWPLKA